MTLRLAGFLHRLASFVPLLCTGMVTLLSVIVLLERRELDLSPGQVGLAMAFTALGGASTIVTGILLQRHNYRVYRACLRAAVVARSIVLWLFNFGTLGVEATTIVCTPQEEFTETLYLPSVPAVLHLLAAGEEDDAEMIRCVVFEVVFK